MSQTSRRIEFRITSGEAHPLIPLPRVHEGVPSLSGVFGRLVGDLDERDGLDATCFREWASARKSGQG